MTTLLEASKAALEALAWADNGYKEGEPIQVDIQKAITALRTAISEAEKMEPFCWLYYERGDEMFAPPDGYHPDDAQPLYLTPLQAPKQEPIPAGYQLVPVEPTEGMVIKFAQIFNVSNQSGTFRPAYKAMLAAAKE